MKRYTVFQIYKAKDGWRWRCCAGNQKIIADSGEAYTRHSDARRALNKFLNMLHSLQYSVDDSENVRS